MCACCACVRVCACACVCVCVCVTQLHTLANTSLTHKSVQEEKIGTVQGSADRLIQARHYAAAEVAERRAAVLARWSQLKSLLGAWRNKLGQSLSFQQFKREADEAELWVEEKMQVACDDSYKDPTDLPVSEYVV